MDKGYRPATLQAEAVSRLLPPSATTVSSKLESSTAIQDAKVDVPVEVVVVVIVLLVVVMVVCGAKQEDRV